MKLRNMKIGTRLLSAFGIVIVVFSCTTGLAIWRLHTVNGMARELVEVRLARQQATANWRNATDLNGTRALAIAKSDSLEVGDYFAAQLREGDRAIASIEGGMRAQPADAGERALLERIASAQQAYLAVRGQVFALKDSGRTMEVEELSEGGLKTSLQQLQQGLGDLERHQRQAAEELSRLAGQAFRDSLFILLGVGALAAACGAGLALSLARSIVAPLRDAATVAGKVASGDLTSHIRHRREDEIGQLFDALRRMHDGLGTMAADIRTGVARIDEDLAAIAHDNERLAERTRAQSGALRDISDRMQDMTVSVSANAASTRHADTLASATAEAAGAGSAAVEQVVDSMHAIHESSRRIVDIVELIDGIAFQTNILALNAAVEAARAGEQGRGFAVVAGEVRTLSQRSAAAAREVRELIEHAARQIGHGTQQADQAGAVMRGAVANVTELSAIVARIRQATETQADGLAEVGGALARIDETTLKNEELVEDAVRAVADLSGQSAQVAGAVSRFRVVGLLTAA